MEENKYEVTVEEMEQWKENWAKAKEALARVREYVEHDDFDTDFAAINKVISHYGFAVTGGIESFKRGELD